MDPTAQRLIVQTHIGALAAEAEAERLGLAARANRHTPSVRAALGRRLIAIGTAIAARPIVDDPCPDADAANPA